MEQLRVHAPSPLSSPPRGRGQGEGAAVSNSISTAKLNNKRNVISMDDTVAAVLQTLPRHLSSDFLFPGVNDNMVTMAFKRACRRAGIADFRLHDLCYTFGSYLAMEGFNLRTIQQLLGHKDLRMTMPYAHFSAEHLQQAVNRLDVVMGEPSEQRKAHRQS